MNPTSADVNKHKVPAELSLTAFLSGSLTIVLSVTYTVLCILALVYRNQCDVGLANGVTGDSYFIATLYRIYIQKDSCANPESSPPAGVLLMSADTVFIFVIATLIASALCCAAAIVLITVVASENKGSYIFAVTCTYICFILASLVIDITFAVFFGVDFAEMASTMENLLPGIAINYRNDVLRLGALFFMTISLKGYLAPIINIVLSIFLGVYAARYRNKLQTEEHSIHKMGALNAYEPQVNRGFVDEESRPIPRSPMGTVPLTPLSEYSNNRDYDRSTSWQHSPAQRPFSYMEEPRRARASPNEQQWRRDPWPPAPPAPPVPAPDYSPPARRLKSALKPNYM